MKPTELKQEYIQLRAEGRSYSYIADKLHISKSTCSSWEKELAAEIAKLKAEELNSLYERYHMNKEARITQLGDTLQNIDTALAGADLTEVAPEKLLDYKLKYREALQKEYIDTGEAFKFGEVIHKEDITAAYGNLLNRVRAGDTTPEQARQESYILGNLLKAYEITEIKAKLDEIAGAIGGI